ncbi:unnamed protein product [Arctogadus glacialis]
MPAPPCDDRCPRRMSKMAAAVARAGSRGAGPARRFFWGEETPSAWGGTDPESETPQKRPDVHSHQRSINKIALRLVSQGSPVAGVIAP